MRIVRWASQERVDLPDLTAVSTLVLGEFRRTIRGALLGDEGSGFRNYLVRGFLVEQSAVPDTFANVRLDPGGGAPLSFAFGSENRGAVTDFGQVVGGMDIDGNLEGNALQTIDFAAQVAGTYHVQMRFVRYSTSIGVNDNRAFWNAATNTEFIAATATRSLPLYELQLAGALPVAGSEWIELATVVWAGATVVTANITDAREFAFEGITPYQQATQNAASGGMADFSRSAARGTNGFNEVYRVMRGLGRQIQDIKGPDSSGQWNWWNRVFPPAGAPADLPATTSQTKTLRSIDTVTYTIGDGVTTFGDFNGVSGLQLCMVALANLGASIPEHVRILLRSNAAATFTWNLTTSHVLGTSADQITVEIIGQGGGGSPSAPTLINFDAVAAGFAIYVHGMLVLNNVGNDDAVETANNITLFSAYSIQATNCRFFGRESTGAASLPAIYITNGATVAGVVGGPSYLRNCLFAGQILIGAYDAGETVQVGGIIENCQTANGCIIFEAPAAGLPLTTFWSIRNCNITMGTSHCWGGRGAIDLNSARQILIENCTVGYDDDFDGIHARTVAGSPPAWISVRDCNFFSDGSGAHAVGAGGNGANGTGWGVYVDGSGTTARYVIVDGCVFGGSTTDAGGVSFDEASDSTVSNCTWRLCAATATASSLYTAIRSQSNARVSIVGNRIGDWGGTTVARTAGIHVTDTQHVQVVNNTVSGDDSAAAAITGRGATAVALLIAGGSISNAHVSDNTFRAWEPDTDINRCVRWTNTSINECKVTDNVFDANGGYPVECNTGPNHFVVSNNIVQAAGTNGRAFSVTGTAIYPVVNGNLITLGGAGRTGIDFGTVTNAMCSGNRMHIGTINIGAGTVWGVAGGGGPTNLNFLT